MKECPRCGGSPTFRGKDGYGAYEYCRYCGWQKSVGPQTDSPRTDLRLIPSRVEGLSTVLPGRRSPRKRGSPALREGFHQGSR